MTTKKLEVVANHADLAVLREDLEALKEDMKNDLVKFSKDLQKQGMTEAEYLSGKARKGFDGMQDAGERGLKTVEKKVKAHPAQSVAWAFAAGIMASLLLGGRSRV